MNTAIFLLKFSACLALFLLFYKGVLERESMHHFKRFYLLAALATSFIIPTIVITQYVDMAQQPLVQPTQTTGHIDQPGPVPPVSAEGPMNWEMALGFVYGLGVLVFGIRFLRHLAQIGWRIRRNPKRKTGFITKVLLAQNLPPHTFFRYVFLNKKQHESHAIPPEVLLHEETHARQYHSLDVVFVELAQVLLWFHPLIYLLKSSMTLNHEFLADRAVVQQKGNIPKYQSLLLSYVAQASTNQKPSVPMANAIVHSSTRAAQSRSIKKRFTVMKTKTSKKSIVLRSALLLPLMALLLFGFSQREIISKEPSAIIQDIQIEIKKNGGLMLNGQKTQLDHLSSDIAQINPKLDPYFIKNYVHATILYDESQYREVEPVDDVLELLGISNIHHVSERTARILNQDGFEPSLYHGKSLQEARNLRRQQVFRNMGDTNVDSALLDIIWLEVKDNDNIYFQNEPVALHELANKLSFAHNLHNTSTGFEVQIYAEGSLTSGFYGQIQKEIRKTGIKKITAYSDEFVMPENEFQDEISITPETTFVVAKQMSLRSTPNKTNNLQQDTSPIILYINAKGEIRFQEKWVPLENVKEELSKSNPHLSFDERKNNVGAVLKVQTNTPKDVIAALEEILTEYGTATINIVGPSDAVQTGHKQSATPGELKKYNTLAKKYNDMDRNQMRIKSQEVQRLKELYSKMSNKQRESAEPFPDFPEPPPPPKAPNQLSDREYALREMEKITEEQDPYDVVGGNINLNKSPLPEPKYPGTYVKAKEPSSPPSHPIPPKPVSETRHIKKGKIVSHQISGTSPAPPTPPAPPNPVDHIMAMAKKGAVFFFEGEEISSNKALKIVKEQKNLNIQSKHTNGAPPEVRLTKTFQ